MISQAGRQYERSQKIKPFNKQSRQKMYKSNTVKVKKIIGQTKFSPFNTVSRDSRTSYLLRVTKQPNVHTNYFPKYQTILPINRRSTIDQAKFQRIIGDVKQNQQTLDLSTLDKKCISSLVQSPRKALTVRESHNWRKKHEHYDFSKQQDSQRLTLRSKYSIQQSTREGFMQKLQSITESNFNNFKRFSFRSRQQKSHDFQSDSGHQYLVQIQKRQKSPQYDLQNSKQYFVKKSMPQTKGQKRFYLYKQKIATRHDRIDPNWHTFLEYKSKQQKKISTIDFDQTTDRKDNDIYSKYPIRLSLTRPTKIQE